MTKLTPPRLEHLRRMTDARGLMRAARGDCPDRFAGYDAVDNADALRLCALGSESIEADALHVLARTYDAFLSRGRCQDGRVHHACDAKGRWTDNGDDSLVQSRVARALAAVIVSELPIRMRLSAARWWRELITCADKAWSPRAAANWLIAFGQLRAADPGRDLDRAEALARWLVEDCFYPTRSSDWEWFEPRWAPSAAIIPAGLWSAYELLSERRFASVARVTTHFAIDHLFEDGLFLPVGSGGGWSTSVSKAIFDQAPAETCSVVELLCVAERVTGLSSYGQFAGYAARWFEGNNVKGASLIDLDSGGCRDALTADGIHPDQGSSAIVSYLLTHAALSDRTVIVEEPPVYAAAIDT